MHILLASNSPRRRELMSLTGWTYRTHPAEVDERPYPGEQAEDYVLRLSETKARAAFPQAGEASFVVAADTTVAYQGEILGKPQDESEALDMLSRLRDEFHQVYTAVAVLDVNAGKLINDICCTNVKMRNYSHEEMQAYVASGDPLDKAGAYAIQHAGFNPVESLQGCFANVMGLPLCHLVRTLRQFNNYPPHDITQACQPHLDYACPVFKEIP
jgi:MAF protein